VDVETVNVPDVAPEATVVEAGTVATAVLLELSATAKLAGAALLIVTVPVEVAPPVTDVGFSETPVTVGAVTARVALAEPPLAVAVIFAEEFVATGSEVTVNVPVVAPAATVVVVWTVATEVALEARLTVRPPAGAALERVTVPADVAPPATDVGLRVTPVTPPAVRVKVAVA